MLTEIGAGGEGGAPMIEAWNKIDLLEGEAAERVRAEAARRDDVVLISALTGEGRGRSPGCAATHLRKGAQIRKVTLSASDGEGIAWLHANGEIVSERNRDMETEFEVRMTDTAWARFEARQRERA